MGVFGMVGLLVLLMMLATLDFSFLRPRNWAVIPTKMKELFSFFGAGAEWYVDSANGLDTNTGKSWSSPLKTIAAAMAKAAAGDTIYLLGSFNEAVTCSLSGVRFVGAGTGPNQATWAAPSLAAAASGWCLKLAAANCLVTNIKFRPVVYNTSGVPCAIYLSGAHYARILRNRFQGQTGSYKAIYSPVCDSDNVEIDGNEFIYMNTATHGAAIWGVEAGGLCYSAWRVVNNIFDSCVTAINIAGKCCTIQGNTLKEYGNNPAGAVAAVMTLGIDLSGTGSGGNAVWGNQLGGTYDATLYKVGASGDQWGGNFNVLTGGVTAANPA